jgi:phage-related protein
MKVEFLVLPSGRSPIEEFFSELDEKSLARISALIDLLKEQGSLPFPHARKLQGRKGLLELRVNSKDGAIRVFYVYFGKDRAILVSGFIKKSQKTPEREIERAVNLLKICGVNL